MEKTITVKGTGNISVTPDLMIVSLTLKSIDKIYDKAMEWKVIQGGQTLNKEHREWIMEDIKNETANQKKVELYLRQKKTLELFLERNAISKEQFDKSLGDLTEKMGMQKYRWITEWLGIVAEPFLYIFNSA